MSRAGIIPAFIAILSLSLNVTIASAQGQGKGKAGEKKAEQGQADKADKADHGKAHDKADKQPNHPQSSGKQKARAADKADRNDTGRGSKKSGVFKVSRSEMRPAVRRFADSKRVPERIAAGALARAHSRGIRDDDLIINSDNDRLRIKNKKGDVLIDLDNERARNLGRWEVNRLDDNVKSGAPSFCRSGAGHPNWGRQWCVDKGFGLGNYNDVRWGRTSTIGDIVFGRPVVDRETLLRDALVSTVGNVVLDRLGLHALTLGYTEPVTGVWMVEPSGSRVLMLNSGPQPVAEIVDLNNDDRADFMVVALRPW